MLFHFKWYMLLQQLCACVCFVCSDVCLCWCCAWAEPAAPVQAAPIQAAPVPATADEKPAEEGPAPRLCHLKVWQDFQGYGFNLHAEKGKGGQYIGKVDDESPAAAAGLREGDKIVEVNGTNVANEDHQNVVKAIKSDSTQTRLLVVDAAAFNYYKERDITVNGGMSNIQTIECPDSRTVGKPTTLQLVHVVCFVLYLFLTP